MKKGILTVVFSHGKEGSPDGRKSKIIESCTHRQGQKFVAIDYRDCGSAEERVVKLQKVMNEIDSKVILVGSSMGGYVSAVFASSNEVDGLFLMAPALYMVNYQEQEYKPRTKNITVRHGWKDEIIPFQNSIRFSQANGAKLELVEDNHRMSETVDDLKRSFNLFLKCVKK